MKIMNAKLWLVGDGDPGYLAGLRRLALRLGVDQDVAFLGRLEVDARSRPGRLPLASATALIHNLVLDLAAFNGMEMENMTRGHGWRRTRT